MCIRDSYYGNNYIIYIIYMRERTREEERDREGERAGKGKLRAIVTIGGCSSILRKGSSWLDNNGLVFIQKSFIHYKSLPVVVTSNIRSIFLQRFSISKVAQGASRAGEVGMRHKNHLGGKLGRWMRWFYKWYWFIKDYWINTKWSRCLLCILHTRSALMYYACTTCTQLVPPTIN